MNLETMRAPSLLAQCLPGLLPHDKKGSGTSVVPERDVNVPSPAVEILPAKVVLAFLLHSYSTCWLVMEFFDDQSILAFGSRFNSPRFHQILTYPIPQDSLRFSNEFIESSFSGSFFHLSPSVT